MGILTQISLGNMGSAEAICKTTPLVNPQMNFECTVGTVQLENFEYGLIPTGTKTTNYCTRNDAFDQTCSTKYLKGDDFERDFQKTCVGK